MSNNHMSVYIVIATKGRPAVVAELLDSLEHQTRQPDTVIVVGSCQDDIHQIEDRQFDKVNYKLQVLLSEKTGTCAQRNTGITYFRNEMNRRGLEDDKTCVIFFDDDFHPSSNWVEECVDLFDKRSNVVAITGRVLADGVHTGPLTREHARRYLSGELPAEKHWANGKGSADMRSMYGCNMAYKGSVIHACDFDENLPLYGWQEDRDYTSQARQFGRTLFHPACEGVHLGIRSGRVSGVNFGYSQIANPVYLINKSTMDKYTAIRFIFKHLLSNSFNAFRRSDIDYMGRLRGNLRAIFELMTGRCHPLRILEL